MASYQRVKPDGVVKTSEDSPHQVLHHGVVLLATAVVNMQTGGGFSKAVISSVIGFILLNNQVSDIQPTIAHYVGNFNIVEDSNIIHVRMWWW